MRLTRRFAATVTAATLAAPLLSTPAARADGFIDCFMGDRVPTPEGYDIAGRSCDPGGATNVVVRIRAGSAAGNHRCAWADSLGGFVEGKYCREE
ncbi:hypothetical protein [Actinomadura rubrisoli]|uniref:Uncharacterized protein n=1 Tax=Actinomadura rubrisoli TaxID=2530368 RepID=A0A4R5APR4_9ACTN|nr:hypothetical protein [Actinomadura rubrisoli]TDD75038.1 hypothetical protein E1298_32025 [Actinomadura rubrisoli]